MPIGSTAVTFCISFSETSLPASTPTGCCSNSSDIIQCECPPPHSTIPQPSVNIVTDENDAFIGGSCQVILWRNCQDGSSSTTLPAVNFMPYKWNLVSTVATATSMSKTMKQTVGGRLRILFIFKRISPMFDFSLALNAGDRDIKLVSSC